MIFVEIIDPNSTGLEKGHIYEARENKSTWYIDIILLSGITKIIYNYERTYYESIR